MPAEEIAELFLEVIEGGKSVSGSAEIIQFVADNGAAIAEGVTEVTSAGNGVAAEVTAITETAAGATATTGLGLLAVDVGVAGAAIAPALGILAGVGLYELAPEFWTEVSNTLLEAGQTIGGKVHALFADDGRIAFSEDTIEIYKQAFLDANMFSSDYIQPVYNNWYQITSITNAYNFVKNDIGPQIAIIQNQYLDWNNFNRVKETCTADDLTYVNDILNNYPNKVLLFQVSATTSENLLQSVWIFLGIVSSSISFSFYFDGPYFHIQSRGLTRPLISGVYRYRSTGRGGHVIRGTQTCYSVSQLYEYIENQVENFDESIAAILSNSEGSITNFIYYINSKTISPYVQPDAVYPTEVPFPQTYPDWQPITVPQSIPQPNYYPVELPYVLPEQESAQNPLPQPEINPDPWVRWIIENLPIPEPNPDPYPEPAPSPQPDPDPQPEPEPAPEPDPEPTEPNPPDPNEPVQPDLVPFIPPILDTVNSTKIFTVYNPTSAELDALGAYLWSNNVLETIIKIWQNPLDGVISLRQVYCTPVAGSSHNIILGSLDSGVSAAVVTSQFTTIDCGSVTIAEKNKNVTDYSPYATVHLYLPFIGIVQLDVDEVMNSTLNVKYTVDVYTGTCLAEVYVTRSPDMTVSKILYTFSGNCSQTLPLTASDATGLASTLASLGAAAIGVVAGGGALGAVAGASMVGHSLTHEMINIGHSGSLSSNAGIMGQRKPYVIIGRRHGYDANSYNEIYGYPSNKTVFLSNCSGYVRVKAINLQSAATEEEKKEIIQLLRQGVIM